MLVAGLLGFCAAAVGGLYWYRVRVAWTPRVLTSYLPRVNSTIVYLDLERLRDAGLLEVLAGSKAVEEPEYRKFVEESGFDYRTDLDRIAVAFQGDSRYLIVRGKFDWAKLSQFAAMRGGMCRNSVCNYTPAQALSRSNSFYPLRSNVMALYSGVLEWGVYEVAPHQIDPSTFPVPDAPAWMLVPAFVWRQTALPAGAKTFASVFGGAESVLLSIVPESSTHFKLMADVNCGDTVTAASIQARLIEATDLLRKMMAREKEVPNSKDLSGLLAGGSFQQEGAHVKANWPLERAFLETLSDGK
jgi:hypothetical protein